MAGKGETVKYIIDADTSGFSRGMAEAAIESDIAGKKIKKNLESTSKGAENNFKDIRRNAQQTASQIRNFGTAMQGFNMTSIILGVTALSGAIIELSGAIAAAGSTSAILFPALLQGGAAAETFKTGVSGLSDAFKAIQKNDPKAFTDSMRNLGPAAREVAYALGGINKAFNSIKLNTQQALLDGLGNALLTLGAQVLPTVNAGFQRIGQSMNAALKNAANLAGQPLFSGLLATIFADTAHNIDILSGAVAPLLSLFTNLYLVTRPYVSLLAEGAVNLIKTASAYLGTARGQAALNLAIQEGIIATRQIGKLVSAVFGLLTSVFRTSVESGASLISTLTGIIRQTEAWVNSAAGQRDLINLFSFASLFVQSFAHSLGIALQVVFGFTNALNSLNPGVQQFLLTFLTIALAIGPVGGYFAKLAGSIRLVAVTIFNLIQQLWVVFTAIGAVSSIVLVAAAGLIFLGAIIRGPLGSALIVVGAVIATYIVLNYLLGLVSVQTASAVAVVGEAGVAAGAGLSVAARGAAILQAALIPLLVLAVGVLVILGMLGVFSGKANGASTASSGLSNSLSGLQKSMKGVGSSGSKAATKGLSPLSDSLNNVGDAANNAQGSLAAFDKMNVLTSNAASGAGAGIPGLPSLPDLGGAGGLGAPSLDTGEFDKNIADMMKQFDGLRKQFENPFPNPFDEIGKWINANFIPALIVLGVFVAVVAGIFIAFGFAAVAATIGVSLTIGLIIAAVLAVVAIAILLWKNWDQVTAFMAKSVQNFIDFMVLGFNNLLSFLGGILQQIGNFFKDAWAGIQFVWSAVASFFAGIFQAVLDKVNWYVNLYVQAFKLAWQGIQVIWSVVVSFFQGVWTGIMNIFNAVGTWFGQVFNGAWNAVKAAFSTVSSFFQGVWNSIVSIFGSIGVAVGNAIGGAVKGAINGVLGLVEGTINTFVNAINGVIGVINKIPGVHLGNVAQLHIPRLAKGGIIDSPTFAQLGEAGTEAVMPLENNTGWIDQLASKINSANGTSNGQPLHLTVQIGEDKVVSTVIDLINEKTQMSGRNTILV